MMRTLAVNCDERTPAEIDHDGLVEEMLDVLKRLISVAAEFRRTISPGLPMTESEQLAADVVDRAEGRAP